MDETDALEAIADEQSAVPGRSNPVNWYRSPIDPGTLKRLHRRSDALGWAQTLGYLAVILTTGTLAYHSWTHWPWGVTVALVFLHGTVFAFQINAVHELGHGTVFRTRWLNALFDRVFSFLGWINFQMFEASHTRHHRYTLHPPDDLEVVLPMKLMVRDFFMTGFVNPTGLFDTLKRTIRIALGRFTGDWETKLFPPEAVEARKRPVRWARILLLGHLLLTAASLATGQWILPILISLAPFYGGWLFFLCNNTQHIGLSDNVGDFRLCCRTFTVNPIVQFLYWHMNFHIEHHMFAAVPCYRLGALHRAIRDDLPETPRGVLATWQQIGRILARQKSDPNYQFIPRLPPSSRTPAA